MAVTGCNVQKRKTGNNKSITPGFSLHKSHNKNIKFRIVKLPKDHVDSFDKKLPLNLIDLKS